MKIVHICQYYNEGWGYQENLLPRYQMKLGHDVVVITSDRRPFYPNDKNKRIIGTGTFFDNGVRIERISIKWEFKNRFVVFKDLMGTLEKERPDYIFHHGLTSPSLSIAAKYKNTHKNIFLAADNHADLNISAKYIVWRKFYYEWFWKSRIKSVLRNLDIVFGVTPARCFFAKNFLGIPLEKIKLLPIGADTDQADLIIDTDREKIRNNLNISKKDIVITMGGKLSKDKGTNDLIKIVSNLKDQNLKLFLFGSLLGNELKSLVKKYDNVQFFGWLNRTDSLKILYASDLAVWPKMHTTLVEDAISVNTPLLLRYHGSTSHHIRDNGFYLFSGNSLEIYQILDFVSKNREILKNMRQSSVKQRMILSYDQIAKESVDYFSNLSSKMTHQYYMNDFYCNSNNEDFEKRII